MTWIDKLVDSFAPPPACRHDALDVTVLRAADGVAVVVRCVGCGTGRVGDVTIDTRLTPADGVDSETTIRNNTGRQLSIRLEGRVFELDPDPDSTPARRINIVR